MSQVNGWELSNGQFQQRTNESDAVLGQVAYFTSDGLQVLSVNQDGTATRQMHVYETPLQAAAAAEKQALAYGKPFQVPVGMAALSEMQQQALLTLIKAAKDATDNDSVYDDDAGISFTFEEIDHLFNIGG